MATGAGGAELKKKFVSETEIEEQKRVRQEEWEKVRNPEDPEEAPEEAYDPRSLFEKLQEQKDKKQEDYEEQFKFKNMVKGLDEDESHFLDEVSRQQSLVEQQRRDEEQEELREYRSALKKLASSERKEPERKAGPKPGEHRTSHLSQAHLLAGAVKRRSSSQSSDTSKKQKVESTMATGTRTHTEQESGGGGVGGGGGGGGGGGARGEKGVAVGTVHLPSAAVCVGILPGLGAYSTYSGSSDSESSTDSEV